MPLEGLLEILRDMKEQKETLLTSVAGWYSDKIKILKKDDFKSFDKIKSEDITDEFLGYFSLLTTYCVLAKDNVAKEGPKGSLPIMPRTDFVAQDNEFVANKLEGQFCDGKTSLYDIIEKVSEAGEKLAEAKFKWTTGIERPVREEWTGKADDLKHGTLDVVKFLDYVQGYDKKAEKGIEQFDLIKLMDQALRHSQVGGLNDRMETILGTDKPAPIFEFRNLRPIRWEEVGDTMEAYEEKVIEYHRKAPRKRSFQARKASKVHCKTEKKKPKCPSGQVPKTSGRGCQACAEGEKPNANGDKFEKDNGNQDKCADGEAKTGPGGECKACGKDEKSSAAGDKCEPEVEEGSAKKGKAKTGNTKTGNARTGHGRKGHAKRGNAKRSNAKRGNARKAHRY